MPLVNKIVFISKWILINILQQKVGEILISREKSHLPALIKKRRLIWGILTPTKSRTLSNWNLWLFGIIFSNIPIGDLLSEFNPFFHWILIIKNKYSLNWVITYYFYFVWIQIKTYKAYRLLIQDNNFITDQMHKVPKIVTSTLHFQNPETNHEEIQQLKS